MTILTPNVEHTLRKTPSQERSSATFDAILEATIRLLVQHGPSGFNTTRIAETAGVSVGSLYQYFPNKTSLVTESVRRKLKADVDEMAVIATAIDAPIEEIVRALLSCAIQQRRRSLGFAMALHGSNVLTDGLATVQECNVRLFGVLCDMFGRVMQRPLAPEETMRLFVTLHSMHGALNSVVVYNPTELQNPELLSSLVTMAAATLRFHRE